jgi:DNA-binding LacI/PurR family transcriptional regulator
MVVLSDSNDRPLGALRRKAYAAVKERLSSRVKRRPELVYFADDYIAAGGLLAIAELGLKIPRDIKVVALTNRGNEPASCRELTRIEHDPWDQTHIVYAVRRYLKTRRPVGAVLDSPRYIRGETF